ncbi:MAG: SAM-dependent methyltransferase [Candidatus Kapabacteria bacterium]|nr:SAM-dependent methyltransferase [Candidatus Kapabacteria bacterium]
MPILPEHAQQCVATFSKPPKGAEHVRLVVYAERRAAVWELRIMRFTHRQSFTDPAGNGVESMDSVIERFLNDGWGQVLLQTPEADAHILQKFKQGAWRRTVRTGKPSRHEWSNLTHDRVKRRALDPITDASLLTALDIADAAGVIRTGMSDKYRQICHLIDIARTSITATEVRIVDAGCGKAYLSLALAYVLERDGCTVHLHGVDANAHVIDHCRNVAAQIGLKGASFQCGMINETSLPWEPTQNTVDVLIALHACDTATDDALALALRLGATTILVAPCCHHSVQKQLQRERVPVWARPLLDDGITKERLGDLLTDTLRRDLLRSWGYSAHLEEFVSFDHTPKNILLRAQRVSMTNHDRARYRSTVHEMVEAWGVAPRLVELLKHVSSDLV